MSDELLKTRLSKGPTQVTKLEQLGQNARYRLHLPNGVVLFQFASLFNDKSAANVQIVSVRGDAGVKSDAISLNLQLLGIVPVRAAGNDMWFANWTETAFDTYDIKTTNFDTWCAPYAGGIAEFPSDELTHADIKSLFVNQQKVTVENHRVWASQFDKWMPMNVGTQEIAFTETKLCLDGRLYVKADAGWIVLNKKA